MPPPQPDGDPVHDAHPANGGSGNGNGGVPQPSGNRWADIVAKVTAVILAIAGLFSALGTFLQSIQTFLLTHAPFLASPTVLFYVALTCLILLACTLLLWSPTRRALFVNFVDDVVRRPAIHVAILLLNLACFGFLLFTIYMMGSSAEALAEFSKNHSTEFIERFPDNIDRITQLIADTEDRLEILVDFPGYGKLSNPTAHANYINAITSLISKQKEVSVKCYARAPGIEQTFRQFKYDHTKSPSERQALWDAFKQSPRYQKFVKRFGAKPAWQSMESFAEWLVDEGIRDLYNMNPSPAPILFNEAPPVFAWISDGKRAIFSFYNLGPEEAEISYMTTDKELIRILRQLHEHAK